MKKSPLLVLLYFVLSPLCYSQINSNNDFKIRINEWAMVADNTFEITHDSIKVRKSTFGLAGDDELLIIAIPEKGKQRIALILSSVNFKKIKDNYEQTYTPNPKGNIHNLSDHGYIYDVIIQHSDNYKSFRIDSYKLDFFYELVKQVNLYLPENYQLQYNDEYLKKK